jgi:hypothetical protein
VTATSALLIWLEYFPPQAAHLQQKSTVPQIP